MSDFITFIIFHNGYGFAVITKRERYKWQKMHNTGKKPKVC